MIDYFRPLSAYLPLPPVGGGYLPYWLLFISVVLLFNSLQTYLSRDLGLTKKVYECEADKKHGVPQVTGLSTRTFGTWTLITSIIRLYGAYYYANPQVYQMVQWTFVVAAVHFVSEWLVYGTCKLGKGIAGPLVVSSTSLVWMFTQKDWYLGLAL